MPDARGPHEPGTNARAPASTRERLVDSATELFTRSGVNAVGVNEIRQHAGVAKSTMYQHFRSKDELVVEVLRRNDKDWCARLRASAEATPDPEAALLVIFDLLDTQFQDPQYRGSEFLNVSAEYPDPHHPVRQAIRAHKTHLLDYLTHLATTADLADPASVAATILILAEGATCARVTREDLTAARQARTSATLVLGASPRKWPRGTNGACSSLLK